MQWSQKKTYHQNKSSKARWFTRGRNPVLKTYKGYSIFNICTKNLQLSKHQSTFTIFLYMLQFVTLFLELNEGAGQRWQPSAKTILFTTWWIRFQLNVLLICCFTIWIYNITIQRKLSKSQESRGDSELNQQVRS